MTAKLVVLASGNGSNLQAILDATIDGVLDARVAAVISDNPDAFALERGFQSGRWLSSGAESSRQRHGVGEARQLADAPSPALLGEP